MTRRLSEVRNALLAYATAAKRRLTLPSKRVKELESVVGEMLALVENMEAQIAWWRIQYLELERSQTPMSPDEYQERLDLAIRDLSVQAHLASLPTPLRVPAEWALTTDGESV